MGAQFGMWGGIKAQYFAFSTKYFSFYCYGAAIRPAGAALKPNILHLQSSNFHSTVMGPHLGLRGGIKAQYFAF